MGFIKSVINAVADPRLFFMLAVVALVVMVWKREKVASNAVGYGVLGLLARVLRLRHLRPELPADRHQAGQRADRRPDLPAGVLRLVLDPRGGAERPADRGRAGADREGGVGPRLGLARPGLHRADLADPLLGRPDRLVDLPEGAARAAGQPGEHAEPVEGAVVLPRPAGNARLLRSLAGRRRAARPDHRRADLPFPYIDKNPKGNGYYTFKERKAEITIFLFGFVVLWCSLIVLGTFLRGPNWNFFGPFEFWDIHKLAALTNVNLSEYIWVRALGTGLPTQLVRPRDLRHPARAVLRLRAAGAAGEDVVQGLLREAGRAALLRDACSCS